MPNWAKINLLHRGVRASLGAEEAGPESSGFLSLGTFVKDTGMIGSSARGVSVSPDGTQIVWGDTSFNLIRGGTMSVAHDPTSGVSDTSRAEWQANNFGIAISPDGIHMAQQPVNGTDYADFGTAWDVSTLGARNFTTGLTGGNIHVGCAFNDDGTKYYIGTVTEATAIKQFTCVTPYDVSSVADYGTPDAVLEVLAAWEQPDNLNLTGHIDFNADGTEVFICFANIIMAVPLATGWDLTTASAPESVTTHGAAITGIHWDRTNNDALWVMSGTDVVRYSQLADPSPAAGETEGKPMNKIIQRKRSTGMFNAGGMFGPIWKPDGTTFVIHNTHNTWAQYEQYDCSTPWDVDTAVYNAANDLAENIFFPVSMTFNDDGTRMIVADSNEIGHYDLSTAYDLSSAGAYTTHAMTSGTGGVAFNLDGTKMYVTSNSENLLEYSLSTPYLASSKTLTSTTDVTAMLAHSHSTASNPTALVFDSTGTRLYIVAMGRYIVELYLSTAWQADTAAKVGRSNWQNTTVNGLFLRQDTGSSIYTTDGNTQMIQWDYSG